MAKEQKNLPIDSKWHDRTADGAMARNHVYVEGEYIESPYVNSTFPKVKYHADYVHDRKDGVDYGFTEVPQMVKTQDEEAELGDEWKDAPSVITAPDAEHAKSIAKKASNWRPQQDAELTEAHLAFAKTNGVEVGNMLELGQWLAGLTSAQMKQFLSEARQWEKKQVRSKPAGKKNEMVNA